LQFYNDFRFKSKIKVLGQGAGIEEIRSSSNTMIIGYWSSAGHRGFKLQYTAEYPARKSQRLLSTLIMYFVIMQHNAIYLMEIYFQIIFN